MNSRFSTIFNRRSTLPSPKRYLTFSFLPQRPTSWRQTKQSPEALTSKDLPTMRMMPLYDKHSFPYADDRVYQTTLTGTFHPRTNETTSTYTLQTITAMDRFHFNLSLNFILPSTCLIAISVEHGIWSIQNNPSSLTRMQQCTFCTS
jgi:hypothetical protein